MKQVVIDTSTNALSLALGENNILKLAMTTQGPKQHGEALVNVVDQSLKQLNWTPQDIEQLIIGVGPGSYTGLRIGVTYAKTWATLKQLPLYTVSSLSLIAANGIPQATRNSLIIPMIDARRQTAYTGAYQYNDGKVIPYLTDRHTPWQDWIDQLKTDPILNSINHLILIGEGIDEFVDLTGQVFSNIEISVIQGWASLPHASHVSLVETTLVSEPTLLAPNYALDTLAERQWAQEHQLNLSEVAHDTLVERIQNNVD